MNKPQPFLIKPYLTVIEGRRPKEKLHTGLGQAKNAVALELWKYGCARGGQIWEWKQVDSLDRDWVLLYDIPANTPSKDLPWRKR